MVKEKDRRDSTKQLIEYYAFWLFQYLKRNKLYTKCLEKSELFFLTLKNDKEYTSLLRDILNITSSNIHDKEDVGPVLDKLKESISSFVASPYSAVSSEICNTMNELNRPFFPVVVDEIKNITPGEIINSILTTNSLRKTSRLNYYEKVIWSSVGYRPLYKTVGETTSDKERYLDLKIDTDCDINEIMLAVVSAYWNKKVERIFLEKVEQIRAQDRLVEEKKYDLFEYVTREELACVYKKFDSFDEIIRYNIAERIQQRGRGFDLDDTPRAIGLWLWDYITSEYGEDKPPHKAYAEAMRIFKQKFDCEKLGYAATESGTYRNWYHRTAACIEACDVLSFKGDGRKKKTKA